MPNGQSLRKYALKAVYFLLCENFIVKKVYFDFTGISFFLKINVTALKMGAHCKSP
jgi:hypothetical protein